MPVAETGAASPLLAGTGFGLMAWVAQANLDPSLLSYAAAAAVLGAGFAKPGKNKFHDMLIVAAVIFLSAKIGQISAPYIKMQMPWMSEPGAPVTITLGLFFHLIVNEVAPKIGKIIGRFLPGEKT